MMLFCHQCAARRGYMSPTTDLTLTGTTYQLGKYIEHIAGSSSVFCDSSFENYKNWTVSTLASGWVSVDERGRRTMVMYAGETVGFCRSEDRFKGFGNCVRVVHYDDGHKIHSFPFKDEFLSRARCESCGVALPYDPAIQWFSPISTDSGDDCQ